MNPNEINRRIAEACGLRLVDTPLGQYAAIPEDVRSVFVMSESPIRTWWFDPYHDDNDAIWALKRLPPHLRAEITIYPGDEPTRVDIWGDSDAGYQNAVAEADTTSAAICQALLAITEKATA